MNNRTNRLSTLETNRGLTLGPSSVGALARLLPVVFLVMVSVCVLLSCGSENVSYPNITGEWLLESYRAGERIEKAAETDRYTLRVEPNEMELFLPTKQSVWNGPRKYFWEKGKLKIEGLEDAQAQVLSTSNQRIEFADFYEWSRASFERVTDANRHEAANSSQMSSHELKVLKEIHSHLQGIWEKPQDVQPHPEMVLVVEIGPTEIRGQAFSPELAKASSLIPFGGLKILHLVGGKDPCTYHLQEADHGQIHCKAKGKVYRLDFKFLGTDRLDVTMEIFGKPQNFQLVRRDERLLQYLARNFKVNLERLPETGELTQTRSEGTSPNP